MPVRTPLVWVLQHPLFSKLWVLAPTLLSNFPQIPFHSGKRVSNPQYKILYFGKVIPSTHAFKFLAEALITIKSK